MKRTTQVALSAALITATIVSPAAAEEKVVSLDYLNGSSTAFVSILGDNKISPGDDKSQEVVVRNDGPAGDLRVDLVDIEGSTTGTRSDYEAFLKDLEISWDSPQTGHVKKTAFDLVQAPNYDVLKMPIAQGEQTTVTFAYDFPNPKTTGNTSQVGEMSFAFDVDFTITADDEGKGGINIDNSGKNNGGNNNSTSDKNARILKDKNGNDIRVSDKSENNDVKTFGDVVRGALAKTGLESGVLAAGVVGLGLVGLGLFLLAAKRRKEKKESAPGENV